MASTTFQKIGFGKICDVFEQCILCLPNKCLYAQNVSLSKTKQNSKNSKTVEFHNLKWFKL